MPTQSRQLAAIMFTDIVGYTTLMGEDEQKAFEVFEKKQIWLMFRWIIQH